MAEREAVRAGGRQARHPPAPVSIGRQPRLQAFTLRLIKSAAVSLFLLLLALILYPVWLPWVGRFLVVADPLQKADALVVLSGDENERIAAAAQLFKQGYAGWFILTDMRLEIPDSQGVYSATVRRKSLEQGVPAGRILIVPGQVTSTFEEALRLKEFTRAQGFRSLIVVTSPHHTRRARWLLREAFSGSGVTLIVQPAETHPYRAESWWQTQADRQETAQEYAKILAHLLGCLNYSDCVPLQRGWLEIEKTFGFRED